MKKEIELLYIDLFCGAGGTSTGVEQAHIENSKIAKVIACVNHDAKAIASHAANHPDALHFTEDIRTLELSPLIAHIKACERKYPNARIVLWASLECTNFSKAKGGQPRDADSRTLAEHLFRYIEALDPDYIQIENVEEFMCWGDMDLNGKPLSKDKGRSYERWKRNVMKYGYNFDHRILNAADYGAYTTRKRFFGVFAKQGLPIIFPQPTHCKGGRTDMFGSLKPWKAVKDVLNFEDEGETIFRDKLLAEKTYERIYAGLIKFVAGGKDAFLSRYNTVRPQYTCKSLEEPCGVLTTNNRFAKVQVNFIPKQFSGHPESKNVSVNGPADSITTVDHHAFISAYYGGKDHNSSVNAPAATLTTKDRLAFISAYYGNGHNHSVDDPSPTVTTKDRLAVIGSRFLCSYNFKDSGKNINNPCPTLLTKDRLSLISPFFANYYSGGGQLPDIGTPCPGITTVPKQRLISPYFIDQQFGKSKPTTANKPLGCITQNPKYNLVSCKPWVMNTNFGNIGSSINDPSQTITANRKWHYLMNPQFNSAGGSIDNPCFTLIAHMDKAPPYLTECTSDVKDAPSFIKTDGEVLIYEIYSTDSPMIVKIKEFMALYGIVDIKMRMLRIPELKLIMGFSEDYVLEGNQADQKKFIGNAVEVHVACALCVATALALRGIRTSKVA